MILLSIIQTMSQNSTSKYASVYALINLPKIRNLHENETLLQKIQPTNQEQPFIQPDLKKSRDNLLQNINKYIQLYDTSYDFKFPQSKFPEVLPGQTNTISYKIRNQQQRVEPAQQRLSDEQLEQMRQNGQFQVKPRSSQHSIPSVWKINDCLLKGRVNRLNIWEDGICWCYTILRNASSHLAKTIPRSLLRIIKVPIRYFSLFFGKKSLRQIYSTVPQRELFKEFWTDVMQNQLKDLNNIIGYQFLKAIVIKYEPYIYLQKNENQPSMFSKIKEQKVGKYNDQANKKKALKQSLRKVQNQFHQQWCKVRKSVLNKISSQTEQSKEKTIMLQGDEIPLASQMSKQKDKTVMERLYEQKFLLYKTYLKQKLVKIKIDKKIIQPLLILVTLFSIIHLNIRMKNEKLAEIQANTKQQVKKNNSIRSRNNQFLEESIQQIMKPIREEMQSQLLEKVMKDGQIQKLSNLQYRNILQKYIKFCKNYNQLLQQKKKRQIHLYVPEETFFSSYIIMYPYQIIQNPSSSIYTLKKQQTLSTDTSYHFWKCALYSIRLRSWSLNCFKFFLYFSWYGRFGLRCLCGLEDFVQDQYLNGNQKVPIYRQTVLGIFQHVLQGISQSRNQFESQPDEGLFGKKCSRMCNILQCYVLRFFFVGVIGVLVFYPIIIIIFSITSLILAFTFWIYVPIAIIFVYLFNILIYQFQVPGDPDSYLRVLSLFSNFVLIIIQLFKIIGSVLYLFFIAPLICFIYILFLLLQRGLRTINDSIIVCLIGCLGRTPRRDTNIATKISGPGMSHNFFMSISQEDVYILTQSELQQILIKKFIQLTRGQLAKYDHKFNMLFSFVLRPFGVNKPQFNGQKFVAQVNSKSLLNNFNKKATQYLTRYPSKPMNVRFTKQQIQLYFENSVKIVENYIQRNKIHWVFQEKKVSPGDYQQFTKKLWCQIFNCGEQIFEPLEEIDNRFRLVDEANSNSQIMNKNIRYIIKSLEGEVNLNQTTAKIKPHNKISLLSKDQKINEISMICQTIWNNSEINIKLDIKDPTCILVPHTGLQQLKKHDAYMYQRQKLKALP